MRRAVLKVALFLLVCGGLAWLGHNAIRTRTGVGVGREDVPFGRLPADAADVNFWYAPPSAKYDFATSEAGFEEWVARWRLPGIARGEGPTFVLYYDHAAGKPAERHLADAVWYAWAKDDAGHFFAYDRAARRAYNSGNYR